MSSIWNFLSPLRTGHHYIAKSGNEMFGTVVKHGVNKKTVTKVRVSTRHWVNKYQYYRKKHTNLQVHHEEQLSVTGDKVVVKLCQPVSKTKSYFLQRIVKPIGRGQEIQNEKKIVPQDATKSQRY